ncbi:protein of unknown function [Filimonas lacunae]|uniref:DUF5000 domain-containing protein n=2 Tax=Filimonas lacunae TaxID=477680 RepID=A0A173MKL1_9BACT|nr:hypothetical protein FLA_3973 [Filimonas lacunae]SIT06948.1 protein of unknown function [Filimonas lacunae]
MITIAAGLFLTAACSKKATDYRSFLNGEELIYPGAVTNVTVMPGNGRLMLAWTPSPDPGIAKYVVYWNNYNDSVVIKATTHNASDTVKTLINNLSEYNYSFYINSFDSSGNKSITTTVNNARSYGAIYQSTLYNRLPDASTPFVVNDDKTVTLNFTTPDTINITTTIHYTNAAGAPSVINIGPGAKTVTLPSFLSGSKVTYQSSYIPAKYAIDTFTVAVADTFPEIFRIVVCNKSLFKEMPLPGDAGVYESQTSVSRLWDGSTTPQQYPNIYHSNDAQKIPLALSFDMGAVYNHLLTLEETGRSGSYHSPDNFEIWGIADTTNAITPLPTQNSGWTADMQTKGWTLLLTAKRGDDGVAAMKFTVMDNPPPVRFIRMRILHVASNSDNSANMSELTFWNKE